MPRPLSRIAPDWWDYTTLDSSIIRDAAGLTPNDLLQLSRPGFKIMFYDTLEDFYLAEALEYIQAWRQELLITLLASVGLLDPLNNFLLLLDLSMS